MLKLLDCTLRDGGYINNWEFGLDNIKKSIAELENAGVDIIELGFLKNESYQNDRTVFNSVNQIKELIPSKKKGIDYAALGTVGNLIKATWNKSLFENNLKTMCCMGNRF